MGCNHKYLKRIRAQETLAVTIFAVFIILLIAYATGNFRPSKN